MRLECILSTLITCAAMAGASDANWPRFRGPNGSGVSNTTDLPAEFGSNSNLAWRISVPPGHSSPVIWKDRVFLTGFRDLQCIVLCINLETGKILWERAITADRLEKKSKPNDAASSTPAVDDQGIYAFFSGFGLIAYSPEGVERWRQPLGPFTPPHGMASSPILAGGLVIIEADQIADSYLAGFDSSTGRLRWKTPRPNFVGAYATPVVHDLEILTSGPLEIIAYAADTGKRRWSLPNVGVMPIVSPIVVGHRLYAYNDAVPPYETLATQMKGDRNGDGKISPDEFPDPSFKEAVLAIDRVYGNGDGAIDQKEWDGALKLMRTMNSFVAADLDGEHPTERWRMTKMLTDTASPLFYDGLLYLIKGGGLLATVDPENGHVLRQDRVPEAAGRYFASPVAGDGKIFLVNESGRCVVLRSGPDWTVLTANDLGENCYATPALADGAIIVRTESGLRAYRNPRH